MKRLLLIIILTLSFQTWTKADDIKDFEIEGMSIDDSLLDFFSEKEIKLLINSSNTFFYKNKTYASITTHANFKMYGEGTKDDPYADTKDNYEYVGAVIKLSDKKYKIYEISAYMNYPDDFEECNNKKNEIVSNISSIFKNAKMTSETSPHHYDPSGESISSDTWFYLENGSSSVHCENWSKKLEEEYGWGDKLKVRLTSEEFMNFLFNVQYKE